MGMKLQLLLSLLSTCLGSLSDTLGLLLLNKQYGNDRKHCHRNPITLKMHCRRPDDSQYDDEWKMATFLELTKAPPKPPPTPGCFPDYATVERETPDGSFEVVPIGQLANGDKVKCLAAPLGPWTTNPEFGACEMISKGHQDTASIEYVQLEYVIDGQLKMVAMTPIHFLWSTTDRTKKGPVDPQHIDIQNPMFRQAGTVMGGDVIIVFDKNDIPTYVPVRVHREKNMTGIHDPQLNNGGIIVVNGVLVTTSVSSLPVDQIGHWVSYYNNVWRADSKFANWTLYMDDFLSYENSPWHTGMQNGTLTFDINCFYNHILGDQSNGVDVSNFNNWDSYYETYLAPCTHPAVAVPAAQIHK
jgi:hypothetical protein